MIKKVMRIIASILGLALGSLALFSAQRMDLVSLPGGLTDGLIYLAVGIFFAIITYILSPTISSWVSRITKNIELELEAIPIQDVIFGAIGLIVGLIIAFFISQPLAYIPIFGTVLSVLVYVILGYLGMRVLVRARPDLMASLAKLTKASKDKEEDLELEEFKQRKNLPPTNYKILDTSVIIDGRLADVIKAGFIEGVIIVPNFVLLELQHIADSSDELRRQRGRRGLDTLKEIQNQDKVAVEISHKSYDEMEEVDSKLLAMAKDLNAKLLTNDYNLNKVADVTGVEVLNINELTNAVKAPVIHGQKIKVKLVKEGSEKNQGIAYMDDGTMIVVEDGLDYLGQNVDVVVSSVIQTSAGKMIFSKLGDQDEY